MTTLYYPFFRAKTYDVLAVSELAQLLAQGGKVLPIFEPVKVSSPTLISRAANFAAAKLAVGLVLNPQVGELVGSTPQTTQFLTQMRAKGATVIPVFVVTAQTTPNEVTSFRTAHPGPVIFVHMGMPNAAVITPMTQPTAGTTTHMFLEGTTSTHHQSLFPVGSRVLLKDGFQAQARNASYPPRSFFSDLHLNHASLGFSGFGDFATVGYKFSDSGGPAYAVAIHMTEDFQTQGVFCNHFISTSNATFGNPAGKFNQAVTALAGYCQQYPGKLDFTTGCQELLAAQQNGTFPGLGPVKRMSIKHHLELMNSII